MVRKKAASNFDELLSGLKAAAEDTRLRLLALLDQAELTVSDLTDILGQSQPRISRHLKLLAEAGIVERFREASWAFYRRANDGAGAPLADAILKLADSSDPVFERDRERLAQVRAARQAAAQNYFRKHAARWDELRKLHVSEAAVEAAVREAFTGKRIDSLLDLGTGTGRILELFGPEISRGVGIDLNPEMLQFARANLDRAGLKNCSVRQGDLFNLPFPRDSFDAIVLHQVLHYLDDGARAIREAARVLRPGGRLVVVDFAPHKLEFLRDEHAHRRLGFAPDAIEQWLKEAGLEFDRHRELAAEKKSDSALTVSVWAARDPRIMLAEQGREVA
ncbi:MAG: metalloregulator ArsR/SmtB family transcription factor [Xanthobacteraceae bacterium]|nr:metalloregulator ArsR/SmtB family transcription factor [Xanthobacteraceae bacterium]QYK44314.1 MAG: metalloregulator ArsR/SmtB family transcription factor [Xanthobacteraceae bacterium]HMN51462.1 metalloregulator ArsR/SmtB family transcription factor [Xanthobacteraceae bacterium]